MIRLALVLLVMLGSGCAFFTRDAARLLADADAHAAHGDYPAAMAAYDSYLARYPEDGGADRARAVRMLVKDLLSARAERDRLSAREAELARQSAVREAELTRQQSEMARQASELARQSAARDAELAKVKQELAARQAEVARLREDLEALKRTDLQMERRRR